MLTFLVQKIKSMEKRSKKSIFNRCFADFTENLSKILPVCEASNLNFF